MQNDENPDTYFSMTPKDYIPKNYTLEQNVWMVSGQIVTVKEQLSEDVPSHPEIEKVLVQNANSPVPKSEDHFEPVKNEDELAEYPV